MGNLRYKPGGEYVGDNAGYGSGASIAAGAINTV